jgi:mxaJ protein
MCSSSRSRAAHPSPRGEGGDGRVSARPGGAEPQRQTSSTAFPPHPARACRRESALPSRGGIARCLALGTTLLLTVAPAFARELRVCADPNNLPFSNAAREGFENKIVDVLAKDLGAEVTYTWWAQRRGFIRNTLNAGRCDLMPGVTAGIEMLRTTAPYYRSSYVFLTREDGPQVASFDDPVLRDLTVGVQLVGSDGFNTPPAHALSRRGIVDNLRGYSVYGNYGEPNPPARIVKAVADGEVSVAVVWGPLAGYFAKREGVPLRLAPVQPLIDGPRLPMAFDISMGVRKEDEKLREEIDDALQRRKSEVAAILVEYGVPRLDAGVVRTGLAR